jgi:hypothetical protein
MLQRLSIPWFQSKSVVDEHGCWNWQLHTAGGPRVSVRSRQRPARRIVYEALNGPLPQGFVAYCRCGNARCINPSHIRAATRRALLAERPTIIAAMLNKTACAKGHPLTGANLYTDPRGWRGCRACRNAAKARFLRRA